MMLGVLGEHTGGSGNGSWDALAADSTTWASVAQLLRNIHKTSLAFGMKAQCLLSGLDMRTREISGKAKARTFRSTGIIASWKFGV